MTDLPDQAWHLSAAQIDVIIVSAAAALLLLDDDEIVEHGQHIRVIVTLGGLDRLQEAITRLSNMVGISPGSPHSWLVERLYADARLVRYAEGSDR